MIDETIFSNCFYQAFVKWQIDFPCPECKKPTLDFSTNQNIKKPIICTSCYTQFNFLALQNNAGVGVNQ